VLFFPVFTAAMLDFFRFFQRYLFNLIKISILLIFYKLFSTKTNGGFKIKIYKYIKDSWNGLDVIGISTFAIALLLRLISLKTNEETFAIAR
jgi:hypothetical protein